jgi:flagellar hook-associated protein 1 FlgK
VAARAAGGNAGTLAIGGLEVLDATQPALRATVTLAFPTAGTVSVDGGTPEAWSSGQVIERNGWRLVLSGTPAAGDQVTVADNAGAVGDNRNAVRLAEALRSPQLDSRTLSLTEASTRLVSGVGATTQQAQRNLEVQRIAYDESVRQRQSISGVNLDEEAANLLRFQQAYQASAQVIRAANEVFRMLIDVAR